MKGCYYLMRKNITIFSIFLFLSFSMNTVTAVAEPKAFVQGIYNVSDSKLLIGTSYNIQNTATTSKCILILIDSDLMVQELIRLEPNSPQYALKPLQYGYILVVIGNGNLVLS